MNEITIEGWVVIDEIEVAHDLHLEFPVRKKMNIGSIGKDVNMWESKGPYFTLDRKLFPNIHWDSEPKKVEITIKSFN